MLAIEANRLRCVDQNIYLEPGLLILVDEHKQMELHDVISSRRLHTVYNNKNFQGGTNEFIRNSILYLRDDLERVNRDIYSAHDITCNVPRVNRLLLL